ncbi:MAG: glycoside hydrolase family 27 protein [Anaerolineales bacterium]
MSPLTPTPPMGWNSWNQFGQHVSEAVIKETAEALVKSGLRDAGYTYVVIDDHWHGSRGADGRLYPDPEKFPNGMRAVADFLHARGLKFGIYSDAGEKTCGGRPGSLGHEDIDAQTFAEWEVDYLKYDWCFAPDTRNSAEALYGKMGRALQATGRPIIFGLCEWGHHRPWLWGRAVGGHLWRTTGDIEDSWASFESIGFEQQRGLERYAGPDHWNDPDMLIVGLNGQSRTIHGPGCTEAEYRTHLSLWCLLAAPLMIGCDVRALTEATKAILLNREAIALDQDPLGEQGFRVSRYSLCETWKKPLRGDALAVGLFNRGPHRATVGAHWSDLEINGRYWVRDLWEQRDLGIFDDQFSAEVSPHGCVLLRLEPEG